MNEPACERAGGATNNPAAHLVVVDMYEQLVLSYSSLIPTLTFQLTPIAVFLSQMRLSATGTTVEATKTPVNR